MKIESLTPKQIAEVLDKLAVVEMIGKAVRERAIQLAHAGVTIPGYEPTETAARRSWSSADDAASCLLALGLTKKEIFVQELLSPAQAEKVLRKKKKWPDRRRRSASEDFVDPFADMLSYTDTKPTLRKVP